MIARIKALLFPPKCSACGELLDWYEAPRTGESLCPDCRKKWESEKLETCGTCTRRVTACACMPDMLKKSGCRGFRKLTYYLPARRDVVKNRVIFRIKEESSVRTHAFLASELLPALTEMVEASGYAREDMSLASIPRSASAKAKYGTDQAEMLARALAKESGLPYVGYLARRWRASRAQKGLSGAARLQNAREAFCLSRGKRNCTKVVFLVDDVITTGASAAACARLLRRAGAKRIYCLAVASDDANR